MTSTRHLRELLASVKFAPYKHSGFTAAHSAHLTRCTGEWWLAARDAALSFDPLSSPGLLNALYTVLAAAETAEHYLSNVPNVLSDYERTIADIRHAYTERLAFWYGSETRWRDRSFWRCRVKAADDTIGVPADNVGTSGGRQ